MNDNYNPNAEKSESQNKRILRHLQDGHSITGIEALNKFQCFRLPSRINDIKKAHPELVISDEFITVESGKRVKRYFIKPQNI